MTVSVLAEAFKNAVYDRCAGMEQGTEDPCVSYGMQLIADAIPEKKKGLLKLDKETLDQAEKHALAILNNPSAIKEARTEIDTLVKRFR